MANIDQYIEQIENARYGKDVRDAIVNALNAINTEHHDHNVTSFNTRTGDVLPINGDYNISQISAEGGHDGQIPVVNSNGGFTMRTMHGEIDMLDQLDDVEISSPATGHILRYRNSVSQWENIKPLTISAGSKESSSEGGVHLAFGVTDDTIFNIRGIPIRQSGTQFNLYPSVLASMPTAEGTFLGNNILYVGDTTSGYKQGCIYKCIMENDTYKWQLVCDISGGAESLSVISTQTGTGSKTATLDISTKSSIFCVVKKGTNIVVSKEIPTIALAVNDVIPLGTSANVSGTISSTFTGTQNSSYTANTYAGNTQRELQSNEKNVMRFLHNNTTGIVFSKRYENLAIRHNTDSSDNDWRMYGVVDTETEGEPTFRRDFYPSNLYTTIPAYTPAGTVTNTANLTADLGQTLTAKITYSAANTFTLSVTDSNLTLMLIA